MDGLAATRAIAEDERLADVRIVVLTTFGLDEYVFDAIRSGASGFLVKDTEPDELVQAVRVVAGGDALLSPSVTRQLLAEFASRAKEPIRRPVSRSSPTANGDRRPRRRGTVEPGDRRTAVREPRDREDPRQPGDGEARRPGPGSAGRDRLRVRPRPARLAGLSVTAELQTQVDAALRRAGRRPGLLVVSATDGDDTAFASRGPLPDPPCAPERAVFEIGSITKVFTSLLLAIAAERGELDVDDPLVEHLPRGTRVPMRDGRPIRLVDLATHRSGLPRLPPGFLLHALRHRDDPDAPPLDGGRPRGAREDASASRRRRAIPLLELRRGCAGHRARPRGGDRLRSSGARADHHAPRPADTVITLQRGPSEPSRRRNEGVGRSGPPLGDPRPDGRRSSGSTAADLLTSSAPRWDAPGRTRGARGRDPVEPQARAAGGRLTPGMRSRSDGSWSGSVVRRSRS